VSWLVWRQHRAEAFALGLAVAAIAVALLVLGRPMHDLFPLGSARCAVPTVDVACRDGLARLQQDFGYAQPLLLLLNFVPLFIGAFLGAPLVAREIEGGTWQLAWTQAVPRTRWLAVKLAALGTVTVLLGAAFSAATTWYRRPLDLFGHFQLDGFDVTWLMPPVYALFAFTVAVAAGVLLRRSLPALGAALVVYVAVRVTVAGWLRPHFGRPELRIEGFPAGFDGGPVRTGNPQDWILRDGVRDATGHDIGELGTAILTHKASDAGLDPGSYLNGQGYRQFVVYQPANRFWTFQLIETGIYAALVAILLALVIWRIRRRAY
jgi:hypothetical protein